MIFFLKKHVAALLFPVPLCVGLLLAGALVLWAGKRQRLGRGLVTAGVAALLLLSLPFLPEWGIRRLERGLSTYAPAPGGPAIRWVVVLGGGVAVDPRLPATEQLYRGSLARLVEGIRILRLHPGARLLLSGGAPFGAPRSEAAVMGEAARSLGVPPRRIVLEEKSWDTEEQAAAVKPLVGGDPLVLVTSASHLPRAMALFRKQGLSPIAAPTGLHSRRSETSALDLRWLLPSAGNLDTATGVVYEYLGLAWARIRGKM